MNFKTKLTGDVRSGLTIAALTILAGVLLATLEIGGGVARLSYDLPFVFVSQAVTNDLIMVKMDEQSNREMGQVYQRWDRSVHARFLDRLREDGCQLVVFDVFFTDPGAEQEDKELAAAIKACGSVVLAADTAKIAQRPLRGERVLRPTGEFPEAARAMGLVFQERDSDDTIRRHSRGMTNFPSLPWAAAVLGNAPIADTPANRRADRWLRYYGPYETITNISYYLATNKPPGYFRGKTVFIGGQPKTRFRAEENDEYRTPYTRWNGDYMYGMEIIATTFLNLVRGDWLTRLPVATEVLLVVLAGLIFGYGLNLLRPLPGFGLALAGMLSVAAFALWLFWHRNIWFSWVVIAGAQIPGAWICAVVAHTVRVSREKEALEKELSTRRPSPKLPEPVFFEAQAPVVHGGAAVPDHELVRCIGKGAYGEVWLARNVIGTFHAAKIVYRSDFTSTNSYSREFKGIQKYMPISRKHPALVQILHTGRNDAAGYYYCIMECGDDEASGQVIDPERYSPRNLAKDLRRRRRIPLDECVTLAVALADALDFLHQQGLVHRDVKPSNIIFVNGAPKLADIGLVTEIVGPGDVMTSLGTFGYLAPEGPGSPTADVYSLGKVMYEACMGRNVDQFPEFPTSLAGSTDAAQLLRLNAIILKACEEVGRRYPSAADLRTDLLDLQRQLAGARKA